MKFVNTTKMLVLKKIESPRYDDPTKMSYSVLVMQDEDAGKVSISKEIWDKVKEGDTALFITVYNPDSQYDYSKFRITGIATPTNKATN